MAPRLVSRLVRVGRGNCRKVGGPKDRRRVAGWRRTTPNKLVHILTEITKAQLLVYRLGQLKDAGQVRHDQISMAKRNNVAMALDTARMARDILGANGILSIPSFVTWPTWRRYPPTREPMISIP